MSNDIDEALLLFNLLTDRTRNLLIEMINIEDTLQPISKPERGDNRHLQDNGALPRDDCETNH